jgi:8-amino-7-oxononanoate synthase
LEKRLQKIRTPAGVVTESLFSMDGDRLDRSAWLSLKQKHNFFCIVDEAHALGALGTGGKGIAGGLADVAVGTFGKALGLFGAFVLLPAEIKDYLLNFCAPQIYTTALPEAHAASALDVLEIIAGYDEQRHHLGHIGCWMKAELQGAGFAVDGDAHILAVRIGEEQSACNMARALFNNGYFVLAARYPTVALQKAILRLSLTAEHTEEDARRFINALKEAYERHTRKTFA